MDQKESKKGQLEHLSGCSSKVEVSEPLLELLVVLEELEYLEDPQNSEESVQTRDASKSCKFVHPSVLVTCEENLRRERSQEIQGKPACHIFFYDVLDSNLGPMVSSLICAEEIDDDINAEEYVDQVVDKNGEIRVFVHKRYLKGHNCGCVSEKQDNGYVPECLELAIGHDHVPCRLLLKTQVLVGLLSHELAAEKSDFGR